MKLLFNLFIFWYAIGVGAACSDQIYNQQRDIVAADIAPLAFKALKGPLLWPVFNDKELVLIKAK